MGGSRDFGVPRISMARTLLSALPYTHAEHDRARQILERVAAPMAAAAAALKVPRHKFIPKSFQNHSKIIVYGKDFFPIIC